MSDKITKSPQIRFAGFTDAWEQRKLGDVSERVRGNDGRMDLPTLTISAGSGWLDQRERFSGNIAGKEQKNYTLLSKGELSYNHGNSKLAKYGAVFELRTYEEALVPRVYHSFKTTEEASSDFIEYMFATKIPDRELAKLISSGARMDGLLNINYDEFMSIKITIPKIEEQMEIAKFLRGLDEKITLHQRKLELLKDTKKSLLQKMFPKEGVNVPEIRFAGFTDAWEQHKLGDVTETITKGTTPNDKNWLGPVNYIKTESIDKESGNLTRTASTSVEEHEGFLKRSQMKTNDILFSIVGTLGRVGIVKSKDLPANTNQQIAIIRLKELNPYFVMNQLKSTTIKSYIDSETTIGAQPSLSLWQINKMEIHIPTFPEQEKIGSLFYQLDNLITLHQRELNSLKNLKKSLLQQMFV